MPAAAAAAASSLAQRLAQLGQRFDVIESGLRHLQQQQQPLLRHAAPGGAAAGAASSDASFCPASSAVKAPADLPALQPDPKDPLEVARLRRHCVDSGLHATEFLWVPSNYYQENLQWRRDALHAPTIRHLCKTILMENTHCTNKDCADRNNSRYYLVVYQYVDRFNSDMVGRAIQELNPGMGKKKFNFRLADPAESEKLTGVRSGAVAPFGTAIPIPVILSVGVTQLAPPTFYVGGGHVDCKCRLDTAQFIRVSKAIVAPISVPLTDEELEQIAD
ncbi:conserved hypothetical protein [Leishmania major strain Friedlin]|uniref:YbaK/aminoacyl-tRNA synthetase-associated domain-containing protein n=1 Tax=Leishmania major TaxID=5664 RepID=Q4QCA6_LEIMA|nr:conserved hypothetical protein [Leishmania major strain Friedlin]CAG9573447.1 Aminoacyl-tRNA_editing_domain_containing_protein_-_putative [Leishmania major strain Friedlin]CAJ04435.1 conserved hypothetical protein [Leishmania major strain Friedlin]|eukprot:XP_001683042.1 conserved hypothetical protein [Leishmania major strain Friedlin]